jgi:hypothetical protein
MRNDNQLIWEAFQSKITESRRTPEETERLVKNLERYQYLMSAQEQGYAGDYYFDWDEFEDYSDYENEIESLEKEAEANGYLDQLKSYADFDARDERRSRQSDDPLEDNSYLKNRITKAGKVNKQDIEQRKKGYRKTKNTSVIGRKKPSLP